MRFLIHPLQQHHFASTEALLLAMSPERVEEVRESFQKPTEPDREGYIRRDYVAVETENPLTVLGYASIWPQGEGRFRMDLIVTENQRRQGVGSALLQTLLEALRAQNATIVQARASEDRSEALAFLVHRGFTETNRMILQRLHLANASTENLSMLAAQLRAQGVTVVTLEQEQTQTADWLAKLLKLLCATGPERVGNPYQANSCQTEYWSEEVAANVWKSSRPLGMDAIFLAKVNEQYVGLSFLSQGAATEREVNQGETGVHVDWRRKGIATLLKLHTIEYARQHGYREISTRTASAGMYALNASLGFVQEGTEVRLVKLLPAE